MSVHTVLQYSPTTSKAPNSPKRSILPSLARKCLTGFTVILPKKQISATETGSPVGKSKTFSFTEMSPVAKGREVTVERNLGEFFSIDHFGSTSANRATEHEFDVLLRETESRLRTGCRNFPSDHISFQTYRKWTVHWAPKRWVHTIGKPIPDNVCS